MSTDFVWLLLKQYLLLFQQGECCMNALNSIVPAYIGLQVTRFNFALALIYLDYFTLCSSLLQN